MRKILQLKTTWGQKEAGMVMTNRNETILQLANAKVNTDEERIKGDIKFLYKNKTHFHETNAIHSGKTLRMLSV